MTEPIPAPLQIGAMFSGKLLDSLDREFSVYGIIQFRKESIELDSGNPDRVQPATRTLCHYEGSMMAVGSDTFGIGSPAKLKLVGGIFMDVRITHAQNRPLSGIVFDFESCGAPSEPLTIEGTVRG